MKKEIILSGSTAGGLNLNPTALTTANAVSIYQSFKQLQKLPRIPLQFKQRCRVSLVNNSVAEFGFGAPSGVTAIINNGAFFRFLNGNSVTPVLSFNGTEITGNSVDLSSYSSNYLTYDVWFDDDGATFTIHDTQNDTLLLRQTLQMQNSWVKILAVTRIPIFTRLYNGASTPATAPVLIIAETISLAHDLDLPRQFADSLAMNTLRAGLHPSTYGQNSNNSNSAAPTSATLSNTAAGYTTLGGKFQFAAVAGAETDYALFAFTVPTGFQFICKGIEIESFNMGAAVATTVTTLEWAVGANGASANLSTGAFIRESIGVQSFAVGAAIGADSGKRITQQFSSPLITESARVFAVILKIPVGTATASQIIRGTVRVDGYFE